MVKRKRELSQKQVWDEIAESWNENKKEAMPDVKVFLQKLAEQKKGKLLEIGCGNCRNLLFFKHFDCYGVDFSAGQIRWARKFCRENGMKVKLKKARAEKLPFKDGSFDYVLSIAVIHCIFPKINREKVIREIYRVLKSKGKAIITVWNRVRDKEFKKQGKEQYVPWTKTKKPYLRYYYFFTPEEPEILLKKYFKILKKKVNKNIIFLVEK